MIYTILLSVVIAATAANVIKDPVQGYKEGDRFFYFPGDGDNIVHLVDTLEPVDEAFLRSYGRSPNDNEYWLFTRANPTNAQVIQPYNIDSLFQSNFDGSKPTKFIAHGWNGRGSNPMNLHLTQAFLEDGDVNVIVLDWHRLANRNYITARNGVPGAGRGLGQFINWLASLGVSYDSMHLVGFSLGAHLVGNAGRETGSKVRRITALDPAGPLWENNRDRLVKTDAQYVEVIHTNTVFLGFHDPCGDADFYPNGGRIMPGCWTNNCSHGRAVDYMVASIRHNRFLANECRTMTNVQRNLCTGAVFLMGNSDLHKNGSGIFRVNTGRNYPF
ncbi:hypothetical protein ABMA27_006918 [Loxostege sticticalis]|uniref:Lipase domain-containing protein n=1 Tax=Loxostege sticticalis TaxID=481309 RepID=A0ABR3IKX5_LOXSC